MMSTRPWRDLPKKNRDWILFTDERPVVPVYAGFSPAEVRQALKRKMEPGCQGTFTSARRYVYHTIATTHSPPMKKRVSHYMLSGECPLCHGKRLRRESLSIKFAGFDIADISRLPLEQLAGILRSFADGAASGTTKMSAAHPEKMIVVRRIAADLVARLGVPLDLGLGYLTLERSTPTLSPGELQRLRLATQVHSN
jgi:excinuclease ABC subunit A